MPIIVTPPESSALSQGDILKGICPLLTMDDGQTAAPYDKAAYVLVVSRPCKAIRADVVTVAPVTSWSVQLPDASRDEENLLEKTRRLLARGRDGIRGEDHSDAFYLGPLADTSNRRYAAQLHLLSTVKLPVREPDRQQWVKKHRVARLEIDFLRELHLRLFLSFSRLGFDDYAWLPEADLDLLINAGQREINYLERSKSQAELAIETHRAAAHEVPKRDRQKPEEIQKQLEKVQSRLEPYLNERERRRQNRRS